MNEFICKEKKRKGPNAIIKQLCIAICCLCLATQAVAKDKRTPPPDLGGISGQEAAAFYLGVNAVIWGYPIVLFEQLMRGRTLPNIVKKGNPQSAVNQFGFMRELRGPEYKQIATPNNDTIYAQSFADVSREPLILSVPRVGETRYYGFQLWDPNGDTFGYVGSRATGREAGHYALVGPDWKGTLPDDVKRIDTPYNSFVIWGRIGVDGPEDLKNAVAIEEALRLTPLSQFGKSDKQVTPDLKFSQNRVGYITPPADMPKELSFYFELARALKFTPPKLVQDHVIVRSLTDIGFKNDGISFDYTSLNDAQKKGIAKAVQFGLHLMDVNAQSVGETVNGWRWSRESGIMGANYLFRAAFAKWYTGGNAPEEAIYMDGRIDDQGQPFSGTNRYRIHFKQGKMPQVKAFWSISMYHLSDGSFVANPIKRYSIGDRTPGLTYNKDGSLDIYIQNEAPQKEQAKANWLSRPQKKNFILICASIFLMIACRRVPGNHQLWKY